MKPLPAVCNFLTVLCLTSCADRDRTRADLIVINGAEVGTIDPALCSAQTEGRIVTALFEGLMRFNAAGRPEPGCAQEPVVSADGLTWTFTLRDTARWSDGSPVAASDFVRSWQRLLEPATAADYSSIFYTIAGAEGYNTGKLTDFNKVGIRAPSDRVLVITLANPVPYFRDLLAFMCYCPVHMDTVEKHGQAAWKPGALVSNGPYVLKEWRLNDRIRLEKNPRYWDAANVKMQTIDVLPTDNANTAINLFLTGGADLLIDKGLIPNAIAGALPDKPWFHHRPLLGTWFLRFNATRPPCSDARVRKALTMVIDRRRITEAVTRLGEQPVTTLTPPGTGDGYELPAGLTQNIAEAQRLLAAAGFPGGRGFPVLNYLYPSKFPSDNGIAIELQSMWKESLGITVSLQRQEYKAYLESQKALAYDTSRSSWVGDYNDPNTFLDVFTSTNGNNWTGWKNPGYDRLIAAAGSEPDAAARNRLLHDAETLLLSTECVIAPVYQFNGVQFYHPDKLGGLEANLIDEHPFRTLYWK